MKYIRTENGLEKLTDEQAEAREPKPTYAELRQEEYGSVQEQLEFITEKGLTAWKAKVATIKATYPKPESETNG